jgi:hypothetical protein
VRRHGLALLFAAVAMLHLVPIWRVRLIPTVDGPSHLYNAVVLRELAAGSPEFSRVFAANLRPNPNWLGHALLFVALVVVPPLVAEKLLVSLIVLLFLAGCWRIAGLVDPSGRVYAFLAMPLAFHLLLQMGFYNYSLGVALVLHAIASWWRRRDRRDWRAIALAASWLLLCALAHPLPSAAAMAFIGIAWIWTSRRWQQLLAFVPAALLLCWFFLQPTLPGGQWTWKGAVLWDPLMRVMVLFTFDPRQLTFGAFLGAAYGLLIVATLATRRRIAIEERDVFLLLTIVAVVLFLAAPVSVQEGFLLKARLLIFPYLLILPWLTPRLARLPLAIVLALVAVANVVYIRDAWKRNEKVMVAAIAPLSASAPGRTLLPLLFDHSVPYSHLAFLSHVVSYGAAERRLVDFGNYEAEQSFFPVAFRPGLRRPTIFAIEAEPGKIDVSAYTDIDYIYTWKMPAQSEAGLARDYDLVTTNGDARLYARKKP